MGTKSTAWLFRAVEATKQNAEEGFHLWPSAGYELRFNEHVLDRLSRGSRSGLKSAELTPEFVPTPALLLADGNPAFLELLIGILQHIYKIAGALSSGAAVVEQAADLRPDVIILDISLGM